MMKIIDRKVDSTPITSKPKGKNSEEEENGEKEN